VQSVVVEFSFTVCSDRSSW